MKIKLTHLIIASLISLSVVFSSASNVFSGSRFSKAIDNYPNTTSGSEYSKNEDSYPNTTSASGNDEGPSKPMDDNEGVSLGKYEPNWPQILLDLEITVDVDNISDIGHVKVKNISNAIVTGPLHIGFGIMDMAHKEPTTTWIVQHSVPNGTEEIDEIVHIPGQYLLPDDINDNPRYRLFAWVNIFDLHLYNESNFANNFALDEGTLYVDF